jgi:LuxR family maltose regulon positive regulatory protein
LNKGLNCKLSLVSAPAGYGKSTLLANWVEQQQLPCAWISLDEKDNDPARLFTYLIAGLKSIRLDFDEKLLSTFQDQDTDLAESFLMPLINRISNTDDRYLLVLDDCHLIQNQAIHTAMIFLLDHLPRNMHLIIATRSDPPLQLAKMRAQGELSEIRVNDLRFTAEEAVNFLNQRMGFNSLLEGAPIKKLHRNSTFPCTP